MKIDRSLNLVLTVDRDDGTTIHLHSMPISRAVFDANYRLIARSHSELFGHGTAYAITSGPKIAALVLADVGRENARERGQEGDGGAASLLAEIRRLTNVLCATPAGWESLPADVAIQRNMIDPDDWSEALNAICFFTYVCHMTKRAALPNVLDKMAPVLGVQITSSDCMAFSASLPNLKPAAITAPKAASSIPS